MIKLITLILISFTSLNLFADSDWKYESSEKDLKKQFQSGKPVVVCHSTKVINKFVLNITNESSFNVLGVTGTSEKVCLVIKR